MIYCTHCSSLFRGRPDKKFCSERCRARYNYGLRRMIRKNVVAEIDGALKRNRQILRKICIGGGEVVKRELLISRGFEFKYYTTICSGGASLLCFYCYDMGYSLISESEVLIIRGESPAAKSN
jgi:predicted nucleic acid-binding Zn ribbon protein